MLKTALITVAIAMLATQAIAQVYKCTDPATGEIIYSQTQCATEATSIDVKADRPSGSSKQPTDDDLPEKCTAFLANTSSFKDPASVRMEIAGVLKLEVLPYAGTKILAYQLPVWLNAKNSYGRRTATVPTWAQKCTTAISINIISA